MNDIRDKYPNHTFGLLVHLNGLEDCNPSELLSIASRHGHEFVICDYWGRGQHGAAPTYLRAKFARMKWVHPPFGDYEP